MAYRAATLEEAELGDQSVDVSNLTVPSCKMQPIRLQKPYMYDGYVCDKETYELLLTRELQEVQSRAAQMEKTMRWWSECTANWRDKWSKVRAERNLAREETRKLQIKLETIMKEMSTLKKEKQQLLEERDDPITCKSKANFKNSKENHIFFKQDPLGGTLQEYYTNSEAHKNVTWVKDPPCEKSMLETPQIYEFHDKDVSGTYPEYHKSNLDNAVKPMDKNVSLVATLQSHLRESQMTLQKEQMMRLSLEKKVAWLENDLSLWKKKYEELHKSNQEKLNHV